MPARCSPSLAELQRWMRWALTHPLGVLGAVAGASSAGLPARFAEPAGAGLAVIAADAAPGRTAVDRLSVYGGGYFTRLHGALALEFPRLAAALGDDGFRALVAEHLLRTPSTSPSLADLGEDLAGTLRSHPGAALAPWLVDLARLERAEAEVWLSDAEPAAPWTDAAEDWSLVRLGLAPTARLVRVAWDVVDRDPVSAPPSARTGVVVVWRVEASIGVEWIDSAPGRLLEELARGLPLGDACAIAASLGLSAAEVTAAFARWSGRGWLVRAAADTGFPEQLRGAA